MHRMPVGHRFGSGSPDEILLLQFALSRDLYCLHIPTWAPAANASPPRGALDSESDSASKIQVGKNQALPEGTTPPSSDSSDSGGGCGSEDDDKEGGTEGNGKPCKRQIQERDCNTHPCPVECEVEWDPCFRL